jgi:DnaK suppressor protein
MAGIDKKKLKSRLTTRRAEIQGEIDRLAAELESFGVEQEMEHGSLGNHMAEDGSSVQEQERILAVSADLQDIATQIDTALTRLDEGTYGVCERCGKKINPERLEAFPYVAYCIDCQTIVERQRPGRLAPLSA